MAYTLAELAVGQSGRVVSLDFPPHKLRRLQELGLTPGSTVTPLHRSPRGAITAYGVLDAVIALRAGDARRITVLSL